MVKKCKWCEDTTEVLMHSLADIDWSCVQFGNEEKVFACPRHQEEMQSLINETLEKKENEDERDKESSKRYLENLYREKNVNI